MLFIVFVALFLDNMLLTVVGKSHDLRYHHGWVFSKRVDRRSDEKKTLAVFGFKCLTVCYGLPFIVFFGE